MKKYPKCHSRLNVNLNFTVKKRKNEKGETTHKDVNELNTLQLMTILKTNKTIASCIIMSVLSSFFFFKESKIFILTKGVCLP